MALTSTNQAKDSCFVLLTPKHCARSDPEPAKPGGITGSRCQKVTCAVERNPLSSQRNTAELIASAKCLSHTGINLVHELNHLSRHGHVMLR